MTTLETLKKYSFYSLLGLGTLLVGCNPDEEVPEPVEELEVITDVVLTFTNADDDTDVVTAAAQDPDGEGVEDLVILDEVNLDANKTYILTYEILNALESPAENILDEIQEEAAEHQLFYAFTEGAFTDPTGDGNIDNAADPINYNDQDDNGLNLGLNTTWTTSETAVSGATFRVKLQHQPDVKTATSDSNTGDNDFDLSFTLNIN